MLLVVVRGQSLNSRGSDAGTNLERERVPVHELAVDGRHLDDDETCEA